MQKLILIFLGSGLGGVLRYILSGWAQRFGDGSFPLGTLTVNLIGCFLVGFLSAAFSGRVLIREEYRIALLIGVLGGFTTFSTFGLETFTLLNDGEWARAAWNVGVSVVPGVAAVWIGFRFAEIWLGV